MSTAQPSTIKDARLKKRLTQQALAEAVGVSASAVSRWESGVDEPAPRTAIALTKILRGLKFQHIYPARNDEQGRAAA